MADGLCTGGDPIGDVNEKTAMKSFGNDIIDSANGLKRGKVSGFCVASESSGDKLFENLCASQRSKLDNSSGGHDEEGFLNGCMEDCRKKRCVDRYDSSESSDSGVAVLSCTDCSGSSTASSDITDPGSPFSSSSSHSEDSGSQPAKMPPTQTAHHPPWPWTADEGPPCKRPLHEKAAAPNSSITATAFSKRIKLQNCLDESKRKLQSPSSLINTANAVNKISQNFVKIVPAEPSPNNKIVNNNNNNCKIRKIEAPKMQQGKITEYFRSQVKSKGIKKDLFNFVKQSELKKPIVNNFIPLVDQQTQINSLKAQSSRKESKSVTTKKTQQPKTKKPPSVSVPRKILPAPSNLHDKITINEQLNNIAKFAPAVTLTALSFPPNYTYLHTKTPKASDAPIYVQQFAAIANDKIPIPIINRTPCLNVIQPVQKITTINNFSCVKLNTVVPIVKVNALPSRINGSSNTGVPNNNNVPGVHSITTTTTANVIEGTPLSVETAVPTVLTPSAKPANPAVENDYTHPTNPVTPKQLTVGSNCQSNNPVENVQKKCRNEGNNSTRTEEPYRTEECTTELQNYRHEEKSPTPTTDSDSGISSNKDCPLEISVSESSETVEEQKSPILSQPKTIRFPVKQEQKDEGKSPQHSTDGRCRWAECNSRFDTSGALLEHLQVKHVISQAAQEHYVCFWLGCKVHGRTSCSRSWLERHVLAHAGTKPFRCIVDGCGQRFNSQLMLERHVNGHFNADGSPNNGNAKKSMENGSSKLYKRNGKRIRFRRQPWSARMFDFIDSGIMEGLQHNLLHLTQQRTLGNISGPADMVHLQSQVMARRKEEDGTIKYLLRWHPMDVVPDEWVTEKEYDPIKKVSIRKLDAASKNALKPSLFPSKQDDKPRQKHRRKPIALKQT